MLKAVRRAAVLVAAAVLAMVLVSCSDQSAAPTAPQAAGGSSGSAVPAGAPTGTARLQGGVQRISVDVSTGQFVPAVIVAKPGVPLEISFGQGQGCVSRVLFPAFGIDQDLSQGGAVVKIPAMQPGSYDFSCGMQMVFGRIDVR